MTRPATPYPQARDAPADFSDRVVAGLASAALHALLLPSLLTPPVPFPGGRVSDGSAAAFSVQFIQILADHHRDTDARSEVASSTTTSDSSADGDLDVTAPQATASPLQNGEDGIDAHPKNMPPAVPAHDKSAQRTGSGDVDLHAQYHAALRSRITSMWNEQTQRHLLEACVINLELAPGGAIISAGVSNCDLNAADRNQLEAAALMAQPMPYAGFEPVFATRVDLQL